MTDFKMHNDLLETKFKPEYKYLGWIIWAIATSVFFTEYMLRVAPRAMLPTLQEIFNASQIQISYFSSFYLLSYVAMQIPVGIIIDKYGAKKSLFISTAIFTISSFIFVDTNSLLIAQIMRLLQGFSAAFAFIGALTLASNWFDQKRFSILVGATQALGMIGAAIGPSLVYRLFLLYGYNKSLMILNIALSIITLGILFIVKDKPYNKNNISESTNQNSISPISALKIIFCHKKSWLIAICAGLLYLPTGVIGELWGSFYLSNGYNIPATTANDLISLIFVGWVIGGPISGLLGTKYGNQKILTLSILLSLLFSILLIFPIIPTNLSPKLTYLILGIILLGTGIANSGTVIAYTMVAQMHNINMRGIALGFTNGMSVLVTLICQPIVGGILDLFAHYTNLQPPTLLQTQISLSILIVGGIIAFICARMAK